MNNNVSKVIIKSIITNLFLVVIKILCGIFMYSNALIADGIHSLSDLVTDFVAIIGNHLSKKPADDKHPYGHGKIEYITSIIISVFIIIIGMSLIINAFTDKIIIPSMLVVVVSLITIIFKYILSCYLIKKGKNYNNNILISSGYESRTDVISSIIVLISVLIMQLYNINPIFGYADLIATIVLGIFIIKVGYDILKENLSIIIGEQETNKEILDSLKSLILSINGIIDIKELILSKYGFYSRLSLILTMDKSISLEAAHNITDEVEEKIKEKYENILYINIHMEPD
ncbi:MAG: cation diffusion facilitator family transporter [Clostridium sp.]|nr:cation diffusion facilitator family transporter [Clostridium sp.]MCM1444708.1 cation diffusion facilitator family transporter [Candidatus Amulumruptor caecigallinarius]